MAIAGVFVASLASRRAVGPPRRITRGPGRQVRATMGRTERANRLVYSDETLNYDIWSLPVDGRTGLAAGELVPLTDRLTPDMNPSITGDGRRMYFITARLGTWALMGKDLESGRERTLYSSPTMIYNSRVSGDGKTVYFSTSSSDLAAIAPDGGAVQIICPKCGSVTGVSADGQQILYMGTSDKGILLFDRRTGKSVNLAVGGESHKLPDGGQLSRDGKWAAFQTTDAVTWNNRIYLIPITGALPVPQDQWIPVSGEGDMARDATWTSSGNYLYLTSERDGFRCLWARRLDPDTRQPVGDMIPVRHFHSARQALRNRAASGNIIGLSAGGGRLVFALTESTGNIWAEETPLGK